MKGNMDMYYKDHRILAENCFVSNDSRKTGLNNNDLIIGRSGAGKTGSYVIPNLAVLDHSLIVADTKNNLYRKYSESLAKRGFKVQLLDFRDAGKSCGYNPLSYVRTDRISGYSEQDLLTIASALVPAMDNNEPFWEMAARNYLVFLMAYVMETCGSGERNICSVIDAHQRFCSQDTRVEFDLFAEHHPDSFASRKHKQMMATMSADKTWSCIIEFASEVLNPLDTRNMRTILSGNCPVDIASLGSTRSVLFLNVSDTDRSTDPMVNVFYTQAFQVLCALADRSPESRLAVPVRIILDDFATNTKIPDFDKLISVIRSREVYASIILQSISQLDSLYGNRAVSRTIINNCDHIIYLGGHDRETAEFIAEHAFTSPEKVLTMPRDKEYVITTGQKAELLSKIAPYSFNTAQTGSLPVLPQNGICL